MSDPYVVGAVITGAINGAAAVVGAIEWALGRPNLLFWILARAGQLAGAVYAAFAGIYSLTGTAPKDALAWVYILTPIAVGYFAEQLRVVAAQTVLEKHGYGSAAELRESVDAGQVDRESFVTGIANEVVLREVAVIVPGRRKAPERGL
ncbi:MAG: hypothetical protein REI11_00845, partial [Patulibacter sp.]|nr:hypothetical protein [Patulibacter sp.]